MTRNRTTVLALMATMLATLALWAQSPQQGPPDPAMHVQHQVDHLTKALGLTAAQQQSATTIFTNAANSSKSIHDSLRDAHQKLETAIHNNDTASIDSLSTTIGNLTAQMIANEAKAHAAFFQTLTPDQQAKAQQMHGPMGPMGGPMGHMGMGMHHGPPPQ